MNQRIKIFGIEIDNLTMKEVLDKIDRLIKNGSKSYVVTPNVDHVVKIEKDKAFKQVYENATLVLLDSVILMRAAKFLKKPFKEKISGSDLFPVLCEHAAKKQYKVFFLGGVEGVADKAAEKLKKKNPNLIVCGTYSPPFGFEKDKQEINKIIHFINQKKPDILFIGLGAPKQENFAYRYLNKIQAKVSLCIGASFDFEAGRISRAPKLIRILGFEWFYRFCKEPRRLFKRYFIDDLKFFRLFLKELFR